MTEEEFKQEIRNAIPEAINRCEKDRSPGWVITGSNDYAWDGIRLEGEYAQVWVLEPNAKRILRETILDLRNK